MEALVASGGAAPELDPPDYCWRTLAELKPGMVVARPLVGTTHNRVNIFLAIGSEITADTIAQLTYKGIECVAVLCDRSISPEQQADHALRHKARLHEIFDTDPDAHCQALLDALVAAGPGES
jgi:hypothetical protein